MFKFLEDIKDNFRERITNPFVISFFIAWFLRNWDLLFTLFSFDSNITRAEKIDIINKYIIKAEISGMLWIPLLMALGGILFYYSLTNISRFIAMAFREWVTPTLDNLIGEHNIATKESLKDARRSISRFQKRNEGLETDQAKLFDEKEILEKDLVESERRYDEQVKLTHGLSDSIETLKKEKMRLEDEKSVMNFELTNIRMSPPSEIYFNHLFKGKWKNKYTGLKESGEEFFEIKNKLYYINDEKEPTFSIESIFYNKENNLLSFVKVGLKDDRIAYNKLEIHSDNLLNGTEDKTTQIEYKKISEVLKAKIRFS